MSRVAPVLALLLLACAAKPPPEPATRILALDRPVAIVVDTAPTGLELLGDDPSGRPGRSLGRSPLVLEVLTVDKEIWKYGTAPPPPLEAPLRHEERGDGSAISVGQPFTWVVHVRAAGAGPAIRVALTLAPAALRRGFSTGELRFVIDPQTGAVTQP